MFRRRRAAVGDGTVSPGAEEIDERERPVTGERPVVRDREAPVARRERAPVARRRRGTRVTGAAGAVMMLLARAIRMVAGVLALIIAAGIALIVLDANAANSVVSTVHDTASSLVGPFDGMFRLDDHKLAIAVNWGIALVVYLVIGALVAGLVERLGSGARARA